MFWSVKENLGEFMENLLRSIINPDDVFSHSWTFLSHPKCHIVTNDCDNRVSRNKLLNGSTVELESKFRKIYEIGANIQDA